MTTTDSPTPRPLHVSFTRSPKVRFVVEDGSRKVVDVPVSRRDWDVTHPFLRAEHAQAELGEIDDHWQQHAQWFIDPEKNAAALCVYRPKALENLNVAS